MSLRHRLAALLALFAMCAAFLPSPSEAGFLKNLMNRPPPTAPPQHDPNARWDYIGKPEWVTMQPPLKAVSYVEECRWVDYKKPFHWGFVVTNRLKKTLTLTWTPFAFKKDYLFGIPDIYKRTSTLKPGGTAFVEADAPLGCPNMRGGESPKFYYYVIGDDVRYAGSSQYVRSGFFSSWNQRIADIRRERQEAAIRQEEAMAAMFNALAVASCMESDGCEVVNY